MAGRAEPTNVQALLFDVFGTVVDWRSSLIDDLSAYAAGRGLEGDWTGLIDGWRKAYVPSMDAVRNNPQADFLTLDELHRRSLERLVGEFGIKGLTEDDINYMVTGWHRLKPWLGVVAALERLKTKYILAPLSNGNVGLLTRMAKNAGLPWDLVLGSDVFRHYKPDAENYLGAAKLLNLQPAEVMLVAAHNYDLQAAQALGLKTAFIPRRTEYGPLQTIDFDATGDWTIVADDLAGVADQLGC
ncbi:haloacid dehalogenase type II [Rhodopseudomonas sp. BR0M22]|uniref:haloacid dehalogenase type II n=1 Tax=Rhodopseudomonas sp. BR0M22 TaxID=2269369 RepID=UPI0013E0A894|nr:haloacid dehalogenase type II [Rhodopseudomonas sp. BR0M22]NEW91025.1 haloacid dehalogenase type II [Rhodopseudomonas sp. BR0M22]